ncbi:uncharacterized protein [Eucyclogobius newberryi]|uniref:uncharacterized protein n=1 Tax=Eucyclogobius newberryi TaxID=166745 RepID=UPI003B5C2347
MKLLYCVSIVSALLVSCGGDSYWTTRDPYTTVGPGVDLRGRMVTLSQYSGVTFYQPYYQPATRKPTTTKRTTRYYTTTTHTTTTRYYTTTTHPTTTRYYTTTTLPWTTRYYTTTTLPWTTRYYTTTTTPPTNGVSVCLRFMTDSSSFNLFKLAPRSPLTLSLSSPSFFSLSRDYYSQVSLYPRISLWSSVRTQPWTSVCVVLDSLKNVVQLFQGGSMSIRKIPSSRMVWSGEPVLDISGFDGQVTDLEVWNYPLKYEHVWSYMQNYGSRGTVLSWSNIAYTSNGQVLFEDTYAPRLKQPISSSEGQEQPIRSKQKYRKMLNGKRRRQRL